MKIKITKGQGFTLIWQAVAVLINWYAVDHKDYFAALIAVCMLVVVFAKRNYTD